MIPFWILDFGFSIGRVGRKKAFCLVLCAMLFAFCAAAEAQWKRIFRVGVIGASSSLTVGHYVEALRQGLSELGYIEGENITFETRWAEGSAERLPDLLAELIKLRVDVIVIGGAAGALAAKKAGITTPVVFAAVTDPLGYGLIQSLSRPGGNLTGTALAIGEGFSGKWVELLKESAPQVREMCILRNPTHPLADVFQRETRAAGRHLGIKLNFFEAPDVGELASAFSRMEKQRPRALSVTPSPLFSSQQRQIVDFATRHRLPSMFFAKEFVDNGGLMSYGPSFTESYRRAAIYVDKILKGAKPADLPVEQPTKFEFIINLKAAKQIGLTIPPNVLARANRVIK